jgi:NACHT domain
VSDQPYVVLGVGVPSMLGRTKLYASLRGRLVKPSPDHVTVVGPKHYGKTVLLSHLAESFSRGEGDYLTAVYWDFRRGAPDSDASFFRKLAQVIRSSLEPARPDLARELKTEDAGVLDQLDFVVDSLQEESKKTLVIFDGFDDLFAGEGITKNLLDKLLTWAQTQAFVFVTGSRRPLRELCRSSDLRSSVFWETFNPIPIRVHCLEEADWDELIAAMARRGITVDGSGRKELANWSGGVPILAAAMLGKIYEAVDDGSVVTKAEVDRAAIGVTEEYDEVLADLWDECPVELQVIVSELLNGERPTSQFQAAASKELVNRGLVRAASNHLKIGSRLVADYARPLSSEVSDLNRLFGDPVRYPRNYRRFLELRLGQISGCDGVLVSLVSRAVMNLDQPEAALVFARNIADHALDLIWNVEIPSRSIPARWLERFKFVGERFPEDGRVPQRRGAQCWLLRLITGTEKVERLASRVTKPTSILVDHIQSIGDFGQHREGVIPWNFAASFCFSAVELCELLARDFAGKI